MKVHPITTLKLLSRSCNRHLKLTGNRVFGFQVCARGLDFIPELYGDRAVIKYLQILVTKN
jgi:hypothetical protein